MAAVDRDSHEALRVLLAELIAKPIESSFDERITPGLQKVLGLLGALSNDQGKVLAGVNSAKEDAEDSFRGVSRALGALSGQVAELQEIPGRLGSLAEGQGQILDAVNSAKTGTADSFQGVRRALDGLREQVSEQAVRQDLQQVAQKLDDLLAGMQAVKALQEADLRDPSRTANADRIVQLLAEARHLKALGLGALLVSALSGAGVVWILLR